MPWNPVPDDALRGGVMWNEMPARFPPVLLLLAVYFAVYGESSTHPPRATCKQSPSPSDKDSCFLRRRYVGWFSGKCSEDEERLVRDLFRGYNKLIRPVQNMTEKVDVKFGLAFVQLINVNEKNQIMKSNVWLRLVSTRGPPSNVPNRCV